MSKRIEDDDAPKARRRSAAARIFSPVSKRNTTGTDLVSRSEPSLSADASERPADNGAAPPTGGGGGSGRSGGGNGGGYVGEPLYEEAGPPRPSGPSKRAMRWLQSPSFPMLIFLALSWTSTTLGLLRLISADRGAPTMTEFIVVGVLVFAATITMKLLLDLFLQSRTIMRGSLSLFGYVILMALSVGFGFAFYWELLEARRQSFDGARGAISDTARKLENGRATLAQISAGLGSLASESAKKARLEERVGFTCQANVGPGPGPRREFRRAEAARFEAAAAGVGASLAAEEAKIDALAERLKAIDSAAAKGVAGNAERDVAFARVNADFARFEAEFNAFLTAGPLAGLADRFEADAASYRDPNFRRSGPSADGRVSSFVCTDIAFAAQLDQMASIIRDIDPVSFGSVRVIEGAGATTEAFDRLTTSAGDVLFFWRDGQTTSFTPTSDVLIAPDTQDARADLLAPPAAPRLGLIGRDIVPLFTALIVDLMILVLTLVQGRSNFMLELSDGMEHAARSPIRIRELVRLSRDIAEDPQFQIFSNYRVSFYGRFYIASPTSPAEDPAAANGDRAIANLLWALRAKGMARRAYPILLNATEKISDQLARYGSPAAGREGYELWKLNDSFWEEAVNGIYSDARGYQKRAPAPQRRRMKESA